MSHIRPAILLDIVNTGLLDPRSVLTRAHSTGARAAWCGPDGIWRLVGPNVPRFLFDVATGRLIGLLLEPNRSNLIQNAGCEGSATGIIGSGGAVPTRWQAVAGSGHTINIIGTSTVQGLPCIEIELSAGAVAATTQIHFEQISGIALSASTAYVPSILARRTSGDFSNVVLCGIRGRTDLATANNGTTTSITGISTSVLTRVAAAYTTPADATTGRMTLLWQTSGAGAALTRLLLAVPQMELGAFVTSPILPPAGTPGIAQRNIEWLSLPLSRWGISSLAECSLLIAGRIGPVNNVVQTLAQLTDGASDTLTLRRTSGGLLQFDVVDGGVSQAAINDGAVVAASADIIALASAAPNSFTLTVGGAAESSDVSGTMPTPTTLRIGAADGDTEPAGMVLGRVALWNRQIAAAARLAYAT